MVGLTWRVERCDEVVMDEKGPSRHPSLGCVDAKAPLRFLHAGLVAGRDCSPQCQAR